MRTVVRRLGKSSGLIIPLTMLAKVGIATGDALDITVDQGRIILAPMASRPHEGWAEASKAIAEAGDDMLIV
jgi:antitoxin MazE